MKATIVLIADNDAENFGRKLMLEAHRYGKIGFEMARLPQHISLKQPFAIPDLENMEVFFDGFAKKLCPFDIEFVDMDVFPTDVLGGAESGCMSLRVKETPQLVPCPAEHDNDYVFHMTFAIGGAGYDTYQRAYDELIKSDYNQTFRFSKLGLLYYDDDNITPGTYFCYKVCNI